MARTVRHTATDPVKIDPATWPRDAQGNLKNIFVCACGISKTFPICDGSHKQCRDEVADTEYVYNPATGERSACPTAEPGNNDASSSTG